MGIKILVRQLPPKEVLDPETNEIKLVESPIEMWHAKSESWWLGGFLSSKKKTKEEIVEKSKTFIRAKDALNLNIRIEIEGFPGYHLAGCYDLKRGMVCILSSNSIPDKDTIQLKQIVDKGPPPVIRTQEKRINPLHNLIENILDKDNPLDMIGTKEEYLRRRVWPTIEAVKTVTAETFDVMKGNIKKVIERDGKIEDIAEKAEDLERTARIFRAKAEELADPGCFGWLTRRVGCTIL